MVVGSRYTRNYEVYRKMSAVDGLVYGFTVIVVVAVLVTLMPRRR
jgi:hypothetical protein